MKKPQRMKKKKASDIIASGTLRQKINLLAEHTAQQAIKQKGTLTTEEVQRILDSIHTTAGWDLYDKWVKANQTVHHGILVLKQIHTAYEFYVMGITQHCLFWKQSERLEQVFNKGLSYISDMDKRADFVTFLEDTNAVLYVDIHKQKDGFIKISIDPEENPKGRILKPGETIDPKSGSTASLGNAIRFYAKNAERDLKRGKALIYALTDYMNKNKFDYKAYKDVIQETLTELKRNRAIDVMYSKSRLEREVTYESEKEKAKTMNLFSRYWVYPEPEETEPDQEMIRYYKHTILRIDE